MACREVFRGFIQQSCGSGIRKRLSGILIRKRQAGILLTNRDPGAKIIVSQ